MWQRREPQHARSFASCKAVPGLLAPAKRDLTAISFLCDAFALLSPAKMCTGIDEHP